MWKLKLFTLLQASLVVLLLLFALCEPIASTSREVVQSRRDRSSYYDTSYIPENLSNPTEYSQRVRRPTPSPLTQQYQYQYHPQPTSQSQSQSQLPPFQRQHNYPQSHQEHGDASVGKSGLGKRIADIFDLGSGEGIKLFNNTYNRNSTFLTQTSADRSFINNQTIKVQRTPDGKLGWVLNNLLPLQNATEQQNGNARVKYTADFVFPDSDVQCEERIQTLCTKVRNYPDVSYLETILQPELAKFEKFFFEDLIEPQDFKQRMNYEPDEEPLCKSREVINYPQSGETLDAIKMLILNTDKFKQGVRVELCENEGDPCKREFLGSLPIHYRSSCKQMYIYRQLVALTPDKKEITTGIFKIPSCCKCVIKQLK